MLEKIEDTKGVIRTVKSEDKVKRQWSTKHYTEN
jgi:hypothetical protein